MAAVFCELAKKDFADSVIRKRYRERPPELDDLRPEVQCRNAKIVRVIGQGAEAEDVGAGSIGSAVQLAASRRSCPFLEIAARPVPIKVQRSPLASPQ